MAGRVLTTKDAYSIVNLMVKEATGQDGTIQAVDSSTFVSVGETLLASGVEATLNTLALVLGRTFMAVRPYEAKLRIINALNSGIYANRMRKISFYSREAVIDGASNTDLKTNFATGYDNGSNSAASAASMWEQNQPVPLELNFGGSSEWQDVTTVYEKQLQVAFRSEAEFIDFVSGIMTEKGNDIESQKEAFNRMTILNHIAGVYDLDAAAANGRVINLTAAFNSRFGTAYTSAQLRSTYLKDFLAFFVATFKEQSRLMTYRSAKYHWSPAKTVGGQSYVLLRHTPYDRQRVMLYQPLFTEAEAMVLPEIFRPEYLDINTQYEGVDYWQNFNAGAAIDVVPAIPNTAGTAQTVGTEVELDYVVGMIYDADAIMIDYQLEAASTTPLEARKHYRNMWWSFSKNAINDFTENAVIFIMADPASDDGEGGEG